NVISDQTLSLPTDYDRLQSSLSEERKSLIASHIGLDKDAVGVWFKNQRARFRAKETEDELSVLKIKYGNTLHEKALLESENVRLQNEIRLYNLVPTVLFYCLVR
ncbi:homeobox-leucine zipper protein ATHB-40, partial [Tanacetum coccineum]